MSQSDRMANPASLATDAAKQSDISFSEASGVAIAAILHLLRLVSAELVLLRGLDVQLFEDAARKKLAEFTSPTTNQHAREVGLAFALTLVEQVLVQIRAQAELKKRLSGAHPVAESEGTPATSLQPTLLH